MPLTLEEQKKVRALSEAVRNLGSSKPVSVPRVMEVKTTEYIFDTPESIATKLNKLEGAVEAKVIKDLPTAETIAKQIKEGKLINAKEIGGMSMTDMRWHGGGLTSVAHDSSLTGEGTASSPLSVVSSSSTFRDNEVVSGSGTSWTLAHTPVVGSVHVYGSGVRLTPGAGNDYTISGTTITTVNSYSAGQLLADYRS